MLYVFLCCSVYFCVVLCIVCFVSFSVLLVCICVLNYRHRLATKLQLNIYHIIYHVISYHNTSYHIISKLRKIHKVFRVFDAVFINPLNPELNPICYLLALLGAHHFLHVSGIRVKLLTLKRLMSYIYGAPILDVSRSHTTTHHSR